MPTNCPCPNCNKLLSAPDEVLGQEVQCPSCRHIFTARAGGSAARNFDAPPPPTSRASGYGYEEMPPPSSTPEQRRDYPPSAGDWDRERIAPEDEYEERRPRSRKRSGELPGAGKTRLAVVFLGFMLVSTFGEIVVNLADLQRINQRAQNVKMVQQQPPPIDDFEAILITFGCSQLLLYIVTIVFFCIWIYQAHANLQQLDARGLKFTPGWCVGWFFIPIANLFKPFQAMQEIWKASDPKGDAYDRYGWQRNSGSTLMGLWWACWIAGNVVGNFALRANLNPNMDVDSMRTAAVTGIISAAFHGPAALMLIVIIQKIRKRQVEKYEMLADEADRDW